MNSFWSITLATLAKDIRLEWRSKDALNAMLFFSLLVVVIFMFSFDPLAEESRHIVGGLVWVAFLFAALVALNRNRDAEARLSRRVGPATAHRRRMASRGAGHDGQFDRSRDRTTNCRGGGRLS